MWEWRCYEGVLKKRQIHTKHEGERLSIYQTHLSFSLAQNLNEATSSPAVAENVPACDKCSKFPLLFYGDGHKTNYSMMCCLLHVWLDWMDSATSMLAADQLFRQGLFYRGDPVHLLWSPRGGRKCPGQEELEI